MIAPELATDTPLLDPDQQDLLSERLLEQLKRLDALVSEQRATVLDSGGAERSRGRRMLQRLMRWADAYMARLNRIRSGGPRCRRCGRYLSFEQLDRQLLAVRCGRCVGTPREHQPSPAAPETQPTRTTGVTP